MSHQQSVAVVTELKDESYQEYFSKEVDLQCIREPLFGFQPHQYSVSLESTIIALLWDSLFKHH